MLPLLRSKHVVDRETFEARLAETDPVTACNLLSDIVSKQRNTLPKWGMLMVILAMLLVCYFDVSDMIQHHKPLFNFSHIYFYLYAAFYLASHKYHGTTESIFYLARYDSHRAVLPMIGLWRRRPITDYQRNLNQRVDRKLTRLLDELAEASGITMETGKLTTWLQRRFLLGRTKLVQDITDDEVYLLAAAVRFLAKHGDTTDYELLRSIAGTPSSLPNRVLTQEVAASSLHSARQHTQHRPVPANVTLNRK